jgi:hypothetical protein
MAVYYQKMVDEQMPSLASSASSSTSSLLSAFNNENSIDDTHTIGSPTALFNQKLDFESENLPPIVKTEPEAPKSPTESIVLSPQSSSTKRKRSAIFIPPVQMENSTNPATEVSICKFKFTGGAKPSLQEKKILSVDAGGNFRYYSGTGDKSMRGYEFFPRESLRQSSLNAGSTTNAFLNASGEKIPLEFLPISVDMSKKLLQLPADLANQSSQSNQSKTVDLSLSTPEVIVDDDLDETVLGKTSSLKLDDRKKKKSSNRSLQRAKLEKTFKEKGFLIQTQQLQSAEGATYCKFRQLRKFTRYLFRSWKDYLPSEDGGEKKAPAPTQSQAQLQQQQSLLHTKQQPQQESLLLPQQKLTGHEATSTKSQ